ncbi:glutathione binding-like protein [Rhizobium sp. EC-SD404]|uniref:glutathione S-transferase family protein n=1 Tax=Rhizobium sp. EC-SD404 TaxID=2038389 RepID=UPI0018FE0C59|nr:glutathione binding-like protein [Rhizobium sp. EC-SD404]
MPGTCALGIHIALEWAGIPFEAIRLKRSDLASDRYLSINPMGVVPTLRFDGEALTEASAILLALARSFPILGPEKAATERARFEFERTIIFIGGTLHPHFWPWFVPSRYGARGSDEETRVKIAAEALIAKDFAFLDERLASRPFLTGERKSAADAYLLPMARWGLSHERATTSYPNFARWLARMAADPGVRAAMTAHNLPSLTLPK